MSSDLETSDFEDFDNNEDDKKHKKLINNILNLNRVQNLEKPSRTEASFTVSEYNLLKSISRPEDQIDVKKLTKVLNKSKGAKLTKDKIKKITKKGVKLPAPLKKPQAEKIKRSVSYEKTRLKLDNWEALITSNRASDNLQFPLEHDLDLEINNKDPLPNKWRLKTPFDKKMEEIHPEIKVQDDLNEKFKLTIKEMIEKRKEAAKMRAYQSYMEAKARRKNKIKSKKYHRIEKRERIKKFIKEFELLQKTNPEKALEKLEEIEKTRIEERFTLRHKSTGQWARNKQIRAKYDKNSRQQLAQQLQISRELEQKIKAGDDSENEDLEENKSITAEDIEFNKNNPWINGIIPNKEVVDFVGNYRKYWLENENKKKEELKKLNKNKEKNVEVVFKKLKQLEEKIETNNNNVLIKEISHENNNSKLKKNLKQNNKKEVVKKNKPVKKIKVKSTSQWEVNNTDELEKVFGKLDNIVNEKIKRLKKEVIKKKPNKKCNKKKIEKINLKMESKRNRPIIDEAMVETPLRIEKKQNDNVSLSIKKTIINNNNKEDIDPEDYLKVKMTELKTAIPTSIIIDNDNDDEEINIEQINKQKALISEAFKDDDIIDDFNKEKQEDIEKNKPKDIDLSLPGWGSWGGGGIKPRKKNKRFILKASPIKRNDDKKPILIINENAQSKLKEHQVSEIPFPFKNVDDFEASIRAPIGNTFVTEMSFRKLTKPEVTTKLGKIIEPISADILLNSNKKDLIA